MNYKLNCIVDFVLKSCARDIDVNLNIPLSVNMLCVRDRRVRIRFLQVIRLNICLLNLIQSCDPAVRYSGVTLPLPTSQVWAFLVTRCDVLSVTGEHCYVVTQTNLLHSLVTYN